MKKTKILSLFLCGILLAGVAGCTNEPAAETGKPDTPAPSTAAEVTLTAKESNDPKAEVPDQTETDAETKPMETTAPPSKAEETTQASPPKEAKPQRTDTPSEKTAERTEAPTESPQEQQPPAKEPEAPKQETPKPKEQKPEAPKTAYDYAFDAEAIRKDLIAIGEGMGLTHITSDDGVAVTPDNASWATPVTASESYQGENLKRKLREYVQTMPELVAAYGGGPLEYFTIYVQANGSGSYTFYFLY